MTVILYPLKPAWPPQPPPQLPVTPTQLAFLVPWHSAQVPAIRKAADGASWTPLPFSYTPDVAKSIGWQTSWNARIPAVPKSPDAVSWTPLPYSYTPDVVKTSGWNKGWEARIPAIAKAADSIKWTPLNFTYTPNVVSTIGWHTAWPVSAPPTIRKAIDSIAWSPLHFSYTFGWFKGWELAKGLSPTPDGIIWPAQTPPQLPVTPSQLAFWQRWLNPWPVPPSPVSSTAWAPQVIAQQRVFVPFAWLKPWEAQPRSVKLTPDGIVWAAQPAPNLPVTPNQLAFWNAWQAQIPARRAAESFTAWAPQPFAAIIAAPPFGWYLNWTLMRQGKAPLIPDGVIWTPIPFVYTFGWFKGWEKQIPSLKKAIDGVIWTPKHFTYTPDIVAGFGWQKSWPVAPNPAIPKTPDGVTYVPKHFYYTFAWFKNWEAQLLRQIRIPDGVAWSPQKPPNLPTVPKSLAFFVAWQSPQAPPRRAMVPWTAPFTPKGGGRGHAYFFLID